MTRQNITEHAKLALAVGAVVFCTVTYQVARRVLKEPGEDRDVLAR